MQGSGQCQKGYVRGMFTVEAAFLIPFITFLIIVICYFDLHLFSKTYAVIKTSEIECEAFAMHREAKFDPAQVAEMYCNKRLIFFDCVENISRTISYEGKKVSIEYSFDTVCPVGEFMEQILGQDRFHEEKAVSLTYLDAVGTIRTCRIIKQRMAEAKKGGDKK